MYTSPVDLRYIGLQESAIVYLGSICGKLGERKKAPFIQYHVSIRSVEGRRVCSFCTWELELSKRLWPNFDVERKFQNLCGIQNLR